MLMTLKDRREFRQRRIPIVAALFAFLLTSIVTSTSALAAVTFRAAASAAVGAGGGITATNGSFGERTDCGDITPSLPAGAAGDLLIAQVVARDNNAAVTMPGWSTLFSDNVAGEDYQVFLFYRSATNTAADTNTITQSGTCDHLMARITRFGNVDIAQPLELDAGEPPLVGNSAYSNAGNVDTGAQAIGVANSMLVFASFVADNRRVNEGATFTELYDDADASSRDAEMSLNYRFETTTGTVGPLANFDLQANGNDPNHGVLFAVRPGAQSLSINVPTGTVAGDVMIASVSARPDTLTISPPSGWTLIRQVTQSAANASVLATYSRVAASGEPASYTWSFSGGGFGGAAGGIASFSGVDITTPVDAEAGSATASSLNHTAPSVTTTIANEALLTIHAFTSAATWTPPTGMTEVADVASETVPNAGGISMEMNIESRASAGATGARTAAAGNDADAGATQSVALRATPLTCYLDDFNRADGSPGSDWAVSSSSGSFGSPVVFNNRLRLTDASGNVATLATLQRLFPGAGNRIEVEFDHYAYGGSGADGISLTFSDSSVTPVPGGYGGSLGYAQRTGINGFAGGWLGVGIDEYGNYSNPTEGRVGGPGLEVDSVAIRGSGSGTSGYAYHTGTTTLTPEVDNNGAASPPYHYRIIVDHSNGVNALVSVERDTGSGYVTLIPPYDAKAQAGQAAVPANWILSYTGSTGGATNIHEIDNLQICATTQTAISAIDHFKVAHDGYGINCVDEPVTVSARDASDAILTGYTGSITLDTQTGRGTWVLVSGTAANFADATADDGLATYTFDPADNGTATFALQYRQGTATLDVDAYETATPTTRDDDTEGALLFGPSGFTVTASTLPNPPPSPINDPLGAQTAGTDVALHIAAYGQTPTDSQCGVIESYTGAKSLKFWSTYVDPGTGTTQVTIDGAAGAIGTSEAAAVARPVTFTNGQAQVTAKYKDVGQIRVSMKDDSVADPNLPTGIRGATNNFVVKPARFELTGIARTSDNFSNPGAMDATGAAFIGAGQPFKATVTARDAEGSATPNYGKESTPETVRLIPTLVAPAGGLNPAIGFTTGFGAFANGVATGTDFNWPEVGIITLTPGVGDSDYLGAGDVTGTASGNVGRFTPARYGVVSSAIAPACTTSPPGFTYARQPFDGTMTIQAQTAGGVLTQNYRSGFDTLDPTSELVVVNNQTGSAYDATSASFVAGQTFSDDLSPAKPTGQANLDLQFRWDMPQQAPVDTTVQLSATTDEVTAVAGAPVNLGVTNMRFGRLALRNAFGSELLPLSMPMVAQYYVDNATGFAANGSDGCTAVGTARLDLANNVTDPPLGTPTITTNSGPPATATTVSVINDPVVAGVGNLMFSAPGDGGDGYVNISASLTGVDWLRFDWDGDGVNDNDPSARATFGIYKGSPRNIYLRERY